MPNNKRNTKSRVPSVEETNAALEKEFAQQSSQAADLPPPQGKSEASDELLQSSSVVAEKAEEIVKLLKYDHNVATEAKDAIGKRYRRHDAIGTPYCITVDYETMETNTVTLRNRDTMEQERVNIEDLRNILNNTVSLSSLLEKSAGLSE